MNSGRIGTIVFWFSAVVILCAIAVRVALYGPVNTSDTITYVQWSDSLIDHGFDIVSYLSSANFVVPPAMYITTVFVVGALRVALGEAWQLGFIAVNIVSCLIIFFCFNRIAHNLGLSGIWSAFAILGFSLLDGLLWPTYLLADTYFAALVMVIIAAVVSRSVGRAILVSLLIAFAIFTRPTSPALIAAVPVAYAGSMVPIARLKPIFRVSLLILTILLSSIVFAIVIDSDLLRGSESLEMFRSMALSGQVIHDRPWTWIAEPQHMFDLVILYLLRFAYFFAPWVSGWSLPHNVINCLLMSAFLVSVLAFVLQPPTEDGPDVSRTLWTLLIFVVVGALFHAATLIDYDWRYRFAYSAPIAIFLAVNAATVFGRVKQRQIKF